MANTTEIPTDADKLLFAADVIIFFLNDRYPNLSSEFAKTKIAKRVDFYREHVQKRFSENIKKMIAVIDETQSVLVRRDFLEIKNQGGINTSSLLEYNSLFKDCHFAKGFRARNFLMYCARVAVMACNFFSNGMNDALDIAVDLIKSSLTVESGLTWDILENAALKYANIKSDFSGNVASFLFRRESTEPISSETEDSSNSSTFNSESDSVAEMHTMTEATSAEFISATVSKLDCSNTEFTNFVQCESEGNVTTSENLHSNALNALESSTASSIPAFSVADIERSIRNAFLKEESTSEPPSSSSSVNIPAKTSNYKSCLGKRPSPRKGQISSAFGSTALDKDPPAAAGDDLETGVKKPKLSLPETIE